MDFLLKLIGIFVFASGTTCAADVTRIALKPAATIQNSRITLGDIATFQGEPAIVDRISVLEVGKFESTSKPVVVTAKRVEIHLMLAGIQLEKFQIYGTATRAVQKPTLAYREQVIEMLRTAIAKGFDIPPTDVSVGLSTIQLDRIFPSDVGSLQFQLPISGREALGRRSVRIASYQDGEFLKHFDLTIDSRIILPTPVASRRIERGAVFSNANVRFERKEFVRESEVLKADDLFGQRAGRTVMSGSPLNSSLIASRVISSKSDLIVKTRDPVIVFAKLGKVHLVLNNATALTSGKRGELIRVRNESSKKELTCRVLAPNRVEVIR